MGCSCLKDIKVENVPNEPYIPQKKLKDHTNPILYQSMKYIIKQMETCICKIITNDKYGTGFFCLLPFPDMNNRLPVLVTNNHVLDSEALEIGKEIEFTTNDDKFHFKILLDKERKIYTNDKPFDTSIIEIKKNDKNILLLNFLEIDEQMFDINDYEIYNQKSVYLVHYPKGKKMEYSPGAIRYISLDNYNIQHYCPSETGSSGCPIINLLNYKVIGIHKGSKGLSNWNLGTLIKGPVKEFNEIYKSHINNEQIKSYVKIFKVNHNIDIDSIDEITIKYKKSNKSFLTDDENEEIRETYGEKVSSDKLFGEKFVENNKGICHIIIDGKESELISQYDNFKKNEILEIQLKGIKNIEDMSHMFFGCSSLIELPNISKINTINVTNMKKMFFGCCSLVQVPDISNWDLSNVTDISGMFSYWKDVRSLPDISKWNTDNVNDFSTIFTYCSSLKSLPDISKWNTEKALTFFGMFQNCLSLISLPDISKWNTTNVTDMSSLFRGCSSLVSLPDISKWDTSNVVRMLQTFVECSTLKTLPDLSKWNTENIENMSYLFRDCNSLISLPDISKWNMSKMQDISSMFESCQQIKHLPDI